MKTKKKPLLLLSAVLLTATLITCFALFAGAATVTPEMKIGYCNLSFADNIRIKYAVSSNVDGVELLVWRSPKSDYVYGTQDDILTDSYTENIGGVPHYIFDFDGFSAKNMTDYVYTRAHVKVGDVDYYSDVNKYSILQYAQNMIAKSSNQKLVKLLTKMLEYGAAVQEYHGYKTDSLATASWYTVKLTAGWLPDGMREGLYLTGETVTLAAPDKDGTKSFSHWIDSDGNKVSSHVTVGKKDETYTPVYVNYSTGLTYVSNGDGTCYVSGIGTCTDSEIIIPPTSPDGDTVTGIGEGAFKGSDMTEITLPKSVNSVGKDAFADCASLDKVNFDGKEADWNSISIADGNDALDNATKYLDGTVLSNSLSYTVNEDKTTCTVTGIGGCKGSVLGIPESIDGYTVTAIGDKAFADCTQLTEINIPSTVKTIGTRAFYGCTGITEITIPESVTEIGTQIFYKATNLTTVNYYSSYYSSDNAVLSTASIDKVVFKNINAASSLVKNCTNIKEVVLKDGITYIGSSAFEGCTSLTSITIGDSVTSIAEGAFYDCTNLKTVNYTGDIESWLKISFNSSSSTPLCNGASLYFGGELVTDVVVPDTIKKINDCAFEGCTSITSITIPDRVTRIGERAFEDCTSLASITIPDSVTSIGNYAFDGCTSLKTVNYTGDIESWLKISFSGYSSNPCNNGASLYFGGKLVTDVIVPDTITKINDYAFYKWTWLTSITIPDSVTSIGYCAFYGCRNLRSVTIPNSVTSIGDAAFGGYISLEKVYYGGTADQWASISIGSSEDYSLTGATRYYYSETEPTTSGNYWHYVGGKVTEW